MFVLECAQKRFGCSEADVKHVMKSKLSNTAKAFKVQMKNMAEWLISLTNVKIFFNYLNGGLKFRIYFIA